MTAISKLDPRYTVSLTGFDRRGAAAAITGASAGGFTVSGCWNDQADFAVINLFDADDRFGHLFTSKYLPDSSLAGVTLDFDVALTGLQNPISSKYQSVPWGKISYITGAEISGTVPLPSPTSMTGAIAASAQVTIACAVVPAMYDRVQLILMGNTVFDYICDGLEGSAAAILTSTVSNLFGFVGLKKQINDNTSPTMPLTATVAGNTMTVKCSQTGRDSNSYSLMTMYKSAGTTLLYPSNAPQLSTSPPTTPPSGMQVKLTGGIDPTSQHYHLDFSSLGLASVRKAWITIAPSLNYSSSGLTAYAPSEFSAVFSNWTVVDPGSVTPLKLAGAGSVTVGSRDSWASYSGSGWALQVGNYFRGFARQSSHVGDRVTVKYSCQHTHNLYLGTSLVSTNGQFSVSVDGGSASTVSCYALELAAYPGRRLIASGVAAGTHSVVLTVSSGTCLFDYLQAAVLANPAAPSTTYSSVNAALDFDTDQTYKIPPCRALWILSQMGFQGDIDFYAGVFFALKRARNGGNFHQAVVQINGTLGSGDSFFFNISGTALGAANAGLDTLGTLAQRLVNAINGTFVGVYAYMASSSGFVVTTLSPINGFTMSVYAGGGSTATISMSGDIGTGNEGTWSVDPTQASPLNRAFRDYLADFAGILHAAGHTATVALSQELLGPPDANTAGGAWCQRFADGTTVLTATGFGSWGAGVVDGVSGSGPQTVHQIGHGYITGNTVHVAQGANGAVWAAVVVDADHWRPGALISGAAFTIAAGATTLTDLQTSQCTFNPATVTAYLAKCYVQAANILAAAALVPWLQFGEVGWWFFSERMNQSVGYASWTSPISIGTAAPHGFVTGQRVINAGIRGNTAANGTWPIVVTDSTHFTLTGSSGNGNYVSGTGTASGGGMALYDAWAAGAHSLASYYTQDDVLSGGDATWLTGAVKTHIDAIRAAVLAAQSGAKFELLYPCDVNHATVYWTNAYPYPQGGRLNAAANFPTAYQTKSGSGLDRLKIEALSWGSAYRNIDLAKAAVAFPATSPNAWGAADTAYLIPIFNGGCPWTMEYLAALAQGIPLLVLFAADHMNLFDWPLPLPVSGNLGGTE